MSSCYHCGLPANPNDDFQTNILGESRIMCCPGCQAVAEAIVDNGLDDYYRFRDKPAAKGENELEAVLDALDVYNDSQLQQDFVHQQGRHRQIQLTIEGINCAACGWLIEKRLASVNGIVQLAVNVASRRAIISWDPDKIKLSAILSAIEKIGYHALPFRADEHEESYLREHKRFLKRLGLAGLMTMQVMMLAFGLYFGVFGNLDNETKVFFKWISLLLTTPVVLYSGYGFYRSAWYALKGRSVNMDVPISLAVWGSYLASAFDTIYNSGEVYFESVCMFIFLLLISRYLEHASRYKAAQLSANMLRHIPGTATVIENGQPRVCLAKQLEVGQQVLVKPGQIIPVDGEVVSGQGEVDESMLNGEFSPRLKQPGDQVFGGTLNVSGSITIRVLTPLKDALINQIVRLQELAMSSKPRISLQADLLSRYFVVFVLLVAAVTYCVWHFIEPERALWICVSVLVATCPCALGLATPSALTCAMARLNKAGILVKRADCLEQLQHIDTVIFDKTGTLTEGRFEIQNWTNLSQLNDDKILHIAASLEATSEHPIAQAFTTDRPLLQVDSCQISAGKGLQGEIDGILYLIGSANFAGTDSRLQATHIHANVYLAKVMPGQEPQTIALFCLSDQVKQSSKKVVDAFKQFNSVLLSGDIPARVEHLAEQLGFSQRLSGQTPQGKLDYVTTLQESGKHVLMIGDGVNDSPVLARADVSVAVNNASDLAKNAADIILLKGSLSSLPQVLEIASRTRSKIRQNLLWALSYNIAVVPLAVAGILSPWMAVIGMSLSSIIVVWNSIRLLKD